MRDETLDLFEGGNVTDERRVDLTPGAMLLPGYALGAATSLVDDVARIVAQAPFRHLVTPGGFRMAVAMTNCGELGWISDRSGYRYDRLDPESGQPWPAMPSALRSFATGAAVAAGFDGFAADACLINRYVAGAKLSLHRDADEPDGSQPIVSVSLGAPAIFLFGGARRADKTVRVPLRHGDVVVWGGPARRYFHGVLPVNVSGSPLLGGERINLTFRTAAGGRVDNGE